MIAVSLTWSTLGFANVLSGALMAALGVFLLAANPRKDWNRLFSLFAVLWGLQIMAANVVRLTSDGNVALVTTEVSLALVVPLYFFVVAFAAGFPRPDGWFSRSRFALAALVLPAAASLVVLFAAPELLLGGVAPSPEGGWTPSWGPALPYLVVAPLYAGFLFALFVMMNRLRVARSPIERTQVGFVLAAFGVLVAYTVPAQLFLFGGAALGLRPAAMAERAVAVTIAIIMLVGFALLTTLAGRLWRVARDAGIEGERRVARHVLAAVGVAFAAAIVGSVLTLAGGPRVDFLGVARIASVALIVYAIARYQLFDIDLRVKNAVTAGSALLAGIAIAAAAWLALQSVDVPSGLGVPVAAVVAVGAFVPLLRATSRVADRVAPGISRDGEHLYLRKLEVYRAAVESHLRDGNKPAMDDAWLSRMRQRLELTERDHAVVVSMAASGADAAPRAPVLEVGRTAFGRYLVERELAQGAYGRVMLAHDKAHARRVVIKELQARWRADAAVVKTFLREARVAGSLRHPNVVGVIEIEQHGEDRFLVMEHLARGSLQERIDRESPLPTDEAVRIARDVLAGLGAAHARGVVHRDVKPANILFDGGGRAKLGDFGIAQLSADDPQQTISGLTTGGFQPGTLQYMSPEQARGAPIDARSDVYAVGAVLYRMLTGRPHIVVKGLDEFTARVRIASQEVPPPMEGLPPPLAEALARALAPEPAKRFPTAAAFAAALPSSTRATDRLNLQGAP